MSHERMQERLVEVFQLFDLVALCLGLDTEGRENASDQMPNRRVGEVSSDADSVECR